MSWYPTQLHFATLPQDFRLMAETSHSGMPMVKRYLVRNVFLQSISPLTAALHIREDLLSAEGNVALKVRLSVSLVGRATEGKLTAVMFTCLHGCKAGPDSVYSEVIFRGKVHYVRPVPVVTNHLMKKH